MNEAIPSLSDIAAVTNAGRGNDGFGGEGSWAWVLIFLIFAFGGWGRNGNGFGGSNGGVTDGYVLASDFATIQRQLSDGFNANERKGDYIQEQLCNGFYNINTAFGNVNQNIMQNGYETRNAISTLGYNLQDCCCQTQRAIDGVNYNMATNFGNLNNTICTATRDIIDSQTNNYRALHDEIVANRIEDKNAQIQAQQNEINALRLKASQEAQNNYLVNQIKPCPIPAFITCNPWATNYSTCGCGSYGSGCGGTTIL